MTLFVYVENVGPRTEREVEVRVLLPREMTPNLAQVRPSGAFDVVGTHELRFRPIAELPPAGKREFQIPVSVDRRGVVSVRAGVLAAGLTELVTTESKPLEIQPE